MSDWQYFVKVKDDSGKQTLFRYHIANDLSLPTSDDDLGKDVEVVTPVIPFETGSKTHDKLKRELAKKPENRTGGGI